MVRPVAQAKDGDKSLDVMDMELRIVLGPDALQLSFVYRDRMRNQEDAYLQ